MREYEVKSGDVTYTAQLSDEDAKRLDAKPVEGKAKTPANKSRTATNK